MSNTTYRGLKTNSKKARANLREYIRNHADFSSYEQETPADFGALACAILDTFRAEYRWTIDDNTRRRYYGIESDAFLDWCAGLPSVLDTCYYYNRSAVDDVAAILEQPPEQAQRYSEQASENFLTRYIYSELKRAEEGARK